MADREQAGNSSFEQEKRENIRALGSSARLRELSNQWIQEVSRHKYSYHFSWLGRPIIQFPQDIVAIQELIWQIRPDLIVETGVAHGGSLILHASMLELLGGPGQVVGIDLEIRPHNHEALLAHPLASRLKLLTGSSISREIVEAVHALAAGKERVLVILDSNHTHDHVLQELELYHSLVRPGSYLVVFDTIIEDLPDDFFPDRPWQKGNNPKTAVREFLRHNDRFEVDRDLESKLLITVAPDGYLRCIR